MSNVSKIAPDESRVRLIAHTLWVEEGMPEGRAEMHWFKALELVSSEAAAAEIETSMTVAAAKPKAKAATKAAAAAKKASPRKRG
jgi:hypothetical protein